MSRSPSIWFAVFVVFLDALGMSIIIPIMPDLLVELTGRPVSETAFIGGVLTAVYALNQFLFGPIIGALSDRYGRRPLILLSLAMLMIDYLLMAAAWSVWILFIGRFLAGLSGASYTVANAYIVDLSSREKRAANLGLVGAAFGLGFVIGPVLGGLAAEFGTRVPLLLAAAMCGVGVVFGLFIMPESLPQDRRRPFSLVNANPFSALSRAFMLRGLSLFLIVHVLITTADFTYPAIWAYWGKATFGWDAQMLGITLAAYGICTAVVQAALIGPIVKAIGEPRTALLGFALSAVAFAALVMARESWVVFAFIPIAALSHLGGAALVPMMTAEVSENEQGELQGVLGAIGAITSIISALVMTAIFYRFGDPVGTPYVPGAPWLLALILMLTAFVPLTLALRRRSQTPG